MSEFADLATIVFPTDWPGPDSEVEPHSTLVFLGNISELSYTKQDVQAVLDRMQLQAPGGIPTTGLELFGEAQNMLVVTLEQTRLVPIYNAVLEALKKIGGTSASEFEYKPHVSISYGFEGTIEDAEADTLVPDRIALYSPIIWWGDER